LPSAPTRAFIEVLQDIIGQADQIPEGLHPTLTRRR
jgi:hypothetical protein